MTRPHAEPPLAPIVELPRADAAGPDESAGQDDVGEQVTIVLLW
ncbi:hypothetical protein ORI20_19825 [Mycobacterium sp. CVI_P3]|uniref:Uncharacterized protein n=1 Tax=Mycobacterium pinniadriaticum TaxID=2994102 RepID=A0ABT3SHM3_9MYCO|nr:hypothetical protein [Mycobacterium pinniadriaticum]MCX2932526.1 hypothetical protein [Mycobacterium pinniadriaticum]MCX2939030.1 hypothetical protein [Mycobacterium pinniadriaticum]